MEFADEFSCKTFEIAYIEQEFLTRHERTG